MKQKILYGWTVIRLLRLAAGTAIAIQGIQVADWLLISVGMLLAVLALLNTACCTKGTCSYTYTKKQAQKTNKY
ncbi:MAG TPA: hypothetical protein PKC39_07315 [Ferruginibacter sp.]|nr:hypothetical protein [Ferruginibacter sp.]HMP20751.1 hypothetical protein [Ferruginibacter sp.]